MAAQPSSTSKIVQAPYKSTLPPVINLKSQATLVDPPNTMDCGRDCFGFNTECMVDFESLKANGRDVAYLFMGQQWKKYFEMLNGLVYFDLVRNFWVKAFVFNEVAAKEAVPKLIKASPKLKGKTRAQLGLPPFKVT
jgi:hypothetical protein